MSEPPACLVYEATLQSSDVLRQSVRLVTRRQAACLCEESLRRLCQLGGLSAVPRSAAVDAIGRRLSLQLRLPYSTARMTGADRPSKNLHHTYFASDP